MNIWQHKFFPKFQQPVNFKIVFLIHLIQFITQFHINSKIAQELH